MFRIWIIHRLIPISVSLMLSSCAYFNTFYNAERYFKEADLLRLEKSDKGIPLRAIDNYGKTIQKCKVVLSDYPESKYVNDAILLMAKAQFYRSEYDNAISNLKLIFDKGSEDQIAEAKYWSAVCKWKKGKTQTAIDELEFIIDGSLKNDAGVDWFKFQEALGKLGYMGIIDIEGPQGGVKVDAADTMFVQKSEGISMPKFSTCLLYTSPSPRDS